MDGCSLSMGASALACAIASKLTVGEINTLAAFLQVLGDAICLCLNYWSLHNQYMQNTRFRSFPFPKPDAMMHILYPLFVFLLHILHWIDWFVILLQFEIQIAPFYRIILGWLRDITDRVARFYYRVFFVQDFF